MSLEQEWRSVFPDGVWVNERMALSVALEEIAVLREAIDAAMLSITERAALRDVDEIQRAHDLLVSLITDDTLRAQVVNPAHHERLSIAADVLCWALHHDHNRVFAENLAAFEQRMKQLGVELIDRECL